MLVACKKYKHQNYSTEEFIQGKCEFNKFIRQNILFLSPNSLASIKERFQAHKKNINSVDNQATTVFNYTVKGALCNWP